MDEVEEIEAGLRRGLQHIAAPPGFTEGVMRRVAEREALHLVALRHVPRRTGIFTVVHRHTAWWTAAAAAVALVAGVGDMLQVRHQRHVREAVDARAQVDLAMQLTSHALNQVQTGLERSSAGRFTQFLYETQK